MVAAMNNFHFFAAVFVGLVLLMLAIGAIAPRSEPWRQPESGVVDMTPWRCELPQGLLTVGGLPPG
jgi:SSS family solute:Na+ symporter